MLKLLTLIIICIHSLYAFADDDLKFDKILFNRDNLEISSLILIENKLLFVADKLSNRAIYQIKFESERFYYSNYIDLTKLQNHNKYFTQALLFKHAGRIVKSPFDLEGLSHCGETFYLVNEQVRHVLKVSNNKLEQLPIDFFPIYEKNKFPLEKISTNAGFEGVAVDCKNEILYIAQERSPRAIIQVNLKTMKVEDMFMISNIEKKTGSSDFSDLHLEGNYLYLLERNEYKISKLDLKTKKIISTVNFGNTGKMHLKEIYATGEPFGLAEGLTMNKDTIYIGVDNNNSKLTPKAEEVFKLKGNFSSIILYKRPEGF